MTVRAGNPTSRRAQWALGMLVAGYFAMALIAGAPNSPLTVLLPAGASPPSWAAELAEAAHLDRIGRVGLTGVAWALVLVVLGAFAVLIGEAWANRVRLSAVLTGSAASSTIAVAAPLLLSRDVYTYAAYGRIESLYHGNPYVANLASFPHDPFVAAASVQWLHGHSHYGPAFTLASAAIARVSVPATIVAFKLIAGAAMATATALTAFTARRTRPDRAPLAAALVGLNPVIVVHTVGGGHVDALIAALVAAAAAVAVTRPQGASARALSVTFLLTLACLVKSVVVPVLGLWLWWLARNSARRHGRTLAIHAALIAALTLLSVSPFIAGWHTLAPFATLGGVEAWASPSHLAGHTVHGIVSSLGGTDAAKDAARIVAIGFLAVFAVLALRVARRLDAPTESWGLTLLLLALSLPYLLPWYAAWFVPLLGLLADGTVLVAGTLVTGVLALTLIPADPFHGLTTPAVMDGVHYGAASALLVVLVVLAARVLRGGNALTLGREQVVGQARPRLKRPRPEVEVR